MAALKLIVGKHPRTGKKHIDVAEITFQHQDRKVQIYMAHYIQIEVDDKMIPGHFPREATLLQVLYRIEEYFANEK